MMRRIEREYNNWVNEPIRGLGNQFVENRSWFINNFVIYGLEPFLLAHSYSLGKNLKNFPKKLALLWFYMEKAHLTTKTVSYEPPTHRNHTYDRNKFFYIFDSNIYNKFLDKWAIEGFLDNSGIGSQINSEIKWFIYCWIDLESSPAREEIDKILNEEAEERKYREKILKAGGLNAYHNNRHDYDASELGYYRGDRIMS
jgi:hypothetical protein